MWWILFLPLLSFAQEQTDIKAIQDLTQSLPEHETEAAYENIPWEKQNRRFIPPRRHIPFERIKKSGTFFGHIQKDEKLIRIADNKPVRTQTAFYSKYYQLPDELGFIYLVNKDGSSTFKIHTNELIKIKDDLVMHEPPRIYTPAPTDMVKMEYDKKLSIVPEASFYTGLVQADYMKDLFNDSEASSGISHQYGLHFFTQWKLPVKVGAMIHYETSTYDLSWGGVLKYQSISFGPQFKSRDFEILAFPLRVQSNIRVSPWARAHAETQNGNIDFKFNSTDFMTSLEHPIHNGWGAFVVGVFFQAQWLDLRSQTQIVSVEASNEINKTLGLSLSQVFE